GFVAVRVIPGEPSNGVTQSTKVYKS
ncbi:MAG: hypothetical protein JWQ32_2176, partial [Marmoricola sp.]|nr:hypothetical protein [Marmoricola sp.]